MSDLLSEKNTQLGDLAEDAVDVGEIATGDVPVAATIYHLARAATDIGEAEIDSALGDEESSKKHQEDMGIDLIEALPGASVEMQLGGPKAEEALREKLYGKHHAPAAGVDPEAKASHDKYVEALSHANNYDDDADALYQLQKYKYQSQLNDEIANGSLGPDGYHKRRDAPNPDKAIADSHTMTGFWEAKGYECAAPVLSAFGVGPPSDDELRAKQHDYGL